MRDKFADSKVNWNATPVGMLGVLFVGLKLTGHIDWSWWWVTAPFWGLPAIVFTFLIFWSSLHILDEWLRNK